MSIFGNKSIDDIKLSRGVFTDVIKECKSIFKYIFWFSSGINILVLFLPLYTSQVLDRVLSGGSVPTLIMLSLITGCAFLCSSILDICRAFVMVKVSDWVDGKLSPFFIKKTIPLIALQKDFSTGESMRDISIIRNFMSGNSLFVVFDMPWSLIYLIVMYMLNPYTANIAILGIIILVSLAIWGEKSVRVSMRQSHEMNIRNIQEIDCASRNAEVVEAMSMMNDILKMWCDKNSMIRKLNVQHGYRSSIITAVTKFCRMFLQIGVIGTGAYCALTGAGTSGSIIASSILMGRVLAPFEASINSFKQFSHALVSYKRLQNVVENAVNSEGGNRLNAPKGSISFNNVVFTPENSKFPTIKGASFNIMEGDVVGVIGESGSGKSTIAKLLVGIWKESSGSIKIDDCKIQGYKRDNLGKSIGYLPQDIELFNASIAENIARMSKYPNLNEVTKISKIIGVHDLINHLPDGYNTIIGLGGVGLSGGQKQRIALARSFYGDVKIVVLDEPNSNLDKSGDEALSMAIDLRKGK